VDEIVGTHNCYPAEIVHKPGPVNGRDFGQREQADGGARQPGDPARVAGEPRALQVRGVPEPGEGLLESGLVAELAPRRRLGVDHGRPQVIRAGDRQ
jgi:hypothetical protein